MSERIYGSRWWRVDIHAHSPASHDYGKGPNQEVLQARTAKEWLLDYMRAEIDCVVITDHNTGRFVDPAFDALEELQRDKPEGYRDVVLLPGVEVTAHGGVHVLAIFPESTRTEGIQRFLGAVGLQEDVKSPSSALASSTARDVAEKADAHGGMAIAAHIDRPNGLLTTLTGRSLEQAVQCQDFVAFEVLDRAGERHGSYLQWLDRRPEVLGSDAHHPNGTDGQAYPGSRFTWFKMDSPSFEGLWLALVDGSDSILRSDEGTDNPNEFADVRVEALHVENAKYLGRGATFELGFNPWLNTIIGSRGSGKSTVLEFLRLALNRSSEIPASLEREFAAYASADQDGLLTQDTTITAYVVNNGVRYRVSVSTSGPGGLDGFNRTFDVQDAEGAWGVARGDPTSLFPIGIYSQKQVYEMARDPLSLLRIIDASEEVAELNYERRMREGETEYLAKRARIRALEESLRAEESVIGERDDITRQLSLIEDSGFAEVLRAYEAANVDSVAVDSWEQIWHSLADRIIEVAESAEIPGLTFEDARDGVEHREEILDIANTLVDEMASVRNELLGVAQHARAAKTRYSEAKTSSQWSHRLEGAREDYKGRVAALKLQGIEDPDRIPKLVERRRELDERLAELQGIRQEVEGLDLEAGQILTEMSKLRRELTEMRKQFLGQVLAENPFVRVSVQPYGSWESAEHDMRRLLQKDEGFDADIGSPGSGGGLLGSLPPGNLTLEAIETGLCEVKANARALHNGKIPEGSILRDARFGTFMERLQPEALDRIDAWFPEDAVNVEYSPSGVGTRFSTIQTASPGQKTAALLAFLLSYGDGPIVLDQPEDDLDTSLIYDLIVRQLREQKERRQVIVVTHNPNIVVNGDAELVVAMEVRGGQSYANVRGGLQATSVREMICDVMEGGREAFDRRYQRIAVTRLGDN